MSDEKPSLEQRIRQFEMLELPGQPRGMHMGTAYLVQDLWREIERLRAIVRVNGLSWGHSHAEIDALLDRKE